MQKSVAIQHDCFVLKECTVNACDLCNKKQCRFKDNGDISIAKDRAVKSMEAAEELCNGLLLYVDIEEIKKDDPRYGMAQYIIGAVENYKKAVFGNETELFGS